MPICEIKWIDKNGNPTPDNNLAIGRVKCSAHVEQHHGRAIQFYETRWFYICGWHKARLAEPGMHHWVFEALTIED